MRVYKCDRCGKYVTLSLFELTPPHLRIYRFVIKKHLCCECAKSFREWFNNPETKEESE